MRWSPQDDAHGGAGSLTPICDGGIMMWLGGTAAARAWRSLVSQSAVPDLRFHGAPPKGVVGQPERRIVVAGTKLW